MGGAGAGRNGCGGVACAMADRTGNTGCLGMFGMFAGCGSIDGRPHVLMARTAIQRTTSPGRGSHGGACAGTGGGLAAAVTVQVAAGAENLGAALAGKVVGAGAAVGAACFQGVERITQEALNLQGTSGAGGMSEGGGIGMALLAIGCSREIGVMAGMTAGQAACGRGRGSGRRRSVAGITVGSHAERGRAPDRSFLLEVAADVGAGGVGQIGDRGLIEEYPLVIPGAQGGGRIPFQAVGHVYDAILVTETSRHCVT